MDGIQRGTGPNENLFKDLNQEYLGMELAVEGSVPEWLGGTLLRNGPARFNLGSETVRHWFDGLAMLHAFSFGAGKVTYSNRFLHSNAYRHARATGRLAASAFTADPCSMLFQRIFTLLYPFQLDNANIGIAQVAGRFLAMTETPLPIEFDPDTLATIGPFKFEDRLGVGASMTTAHPLYDEVNGQLYNHRMRVGVPFRYQIYTVARERELVGSLPVLEPGYMHSFGMTRRSIVLSEFPFLMDLRGILSSEVPIISLFRWRPDRPTRFLVFDKQTGALEQIYESEACFGFHHVNAFDTEEGLAVDVIVYPDPSVMDMLTTDTIGLPRSFPVGELRRYHLSRDGQGCRFETLSPEGMDVPQINERWRCRPYRYAYGVGSGRPNDFLNQIVKADLQHHTALTWIEEDCYPGEPVFVQAPGAQGEDEGVILSIALDGRSGRSFLLVLDAATLGEIARARVPHHIPFGFHGMYAGEAGPSA